jgi:hypothetical protein
MSIEKEVLINIDEEEESKEESKDSMDNQNRVEETWNNRNESYLLKIQEDCTALSLKHNRQYKTNRKLWIMSSIPALIIPLILANTSLLWDESHQYVNSIGLGVVAIINTLQVFFNFSKKSEVNNTFSYRYNELSSDVSKILIRKKRHRAPFDVILERISEKKSNLDQQAD